MKIYHFGAEDAPVLLLLPGTCCPVSYTHLTLPTKA